MRLPWSSQDCIRTFCARCYTRAFVATDLVLLNHGQVTRTPHSSPSLNFPTTPMGGSLSLDIFNGSLSTMGFHWYKARTSDMPGTILSVTLTTRLPWPPKRTDNVL
ncbi:hypothetical protein TNCV_1321971 [Trichonephila clavipes]|nr:hypothetical protein TNCV_1321971 [Trichonephila clavipes]